MKKHCEITKNVMKFQKLSFALKSVDGSPRKLAKWQQGLNISIYMLRASFKHT